MLFSFESCNKSQFSNNRNVSSATGWAINNKKGGFQYNTNYKGQQTPPNMVLVEGGTYTKGRVQDDPMRDWNNSPHISKQLLSSAQLYGAKTTIHCDMKTIYKIY